MSRSILRQKVSNRSHSFGLSTQFLSVINSRLTPLFDTPLRYYCNYIYLQDSSQRQWGRWELLFSNPLTSFGFGIWRPGLVEYHSVCPLRTSLLGRGAELGFPREEPLTSTSTRLGHSGSSATEKYNGVILFPSKNISLQSCKCSRSSPR